MGFSHRLIDIRTDIDCPLHSILAGTVAGRKDLPIDGVLAQTYRFTDIDYPLPSKLAGTVAGRKDLAELVDEI